MRTETQEHRITTDICAYCRRTESDIMFADQDPSRCRYGVRVNGVKRHRFDEIEMDARLVEMIDRLDLLAGNEIRPNFWWGFDLPTEGIRFSTEYASGDENIDMLVYSRDISDDPNRGVVAYRVSFQAETPLSVIFAAAAEAMAARRA